MRKEGKIIAVVNQKGGVAKTTTSFNMAFSLTRQGLKVCLVDLDPQANLSMLFGIEKPDLQKETVVDLINNHIMKGDSDRTMASVIRDKEVDLIPSCIQLSTSEINLSRVNSREYALKGILEPLKSKYDYIIIDCMPALGMLTINSLVAADSVLIPITTEYLSAKGLELLLKTVIRVKRGLNNTLKIEGILITQYDCRTNLSKGILELISDAYKGGIKIFDTRIPKSVKVGEANLKRKSIYDYKSSHKAALAYDSFVEELINNG